MKDLTRTMDITMKEMEEENQAAEAAAAAATVAESGEAKPGLTTAAPGVKAQEARQPHVADEYPPDIKKTNGSATSPIPSPSVSGTSTPRPRGIPMRPALMEKSEEDAPLDTMNMTEAEKELRAKEKKRAGLTKEQREELAAYDMERRRIREERVSNLSKKLVDRISIWTETDKGADVTKAFQEKIHLEIENLKMESFGIEMLHAIGATYLQKATTFLKSQKFLGISGFFSRLKDKGTIAKDTWGIVSSAIDAQATLEEMAKAEEKGGEDWTDEKKAEYEKMVTGKILAAAWRGSKYEIQGVLRDVCDRVLNDKSVRPEKRVERAHALIIIGNMCSKVTKLLFLGPVCQC